MKRLQSDAVILSLVDNLQEKGSWCGETHVQKATYFIQELFGVPLGFDFVLYKHGPFSFDLNDELTAMQADMLIELQPKPRPYGPSLVPIEGGSRLKKHFAKTLDRYDITMQFVANKFGKRGVAELERLSTALYVTKKENVDSSVESRAKRINELKPHVHIKEAREAISMVDGIIKDAQDVQIV